MERVSDIVAHFVLSFLSRIDATDMGSIYDFERKERRIEQTFLEVFPQRSRRYLLFIILVGIGMVLDLQIGQVNFQVYGLILDGGGALALVLSVVRGKGGFARDTRETGARLGHAGLHPEELRANIQNTVDGLWGGFLLVSGFTIQILAVVGSV